MPDELRDWREDLYKPSGGAKDVRPDKRLYNDVLYSSVEAMEEAKKRDAEERRQKVMQHIAAKYTANGQGS